MALLRKALNGFSLADLFGYLYLKCSGGRLGLFASFAVLCDNIGLIDCYIVRLASFACSRVAVHTVYRAFKGSRVACLRYVVFKVRADFLSGSRFARTSLCVAWLLFIACVVHLVWSYCSTYYTECQRVFWKFIKIFSNRVLGL